jgi:hypothetical protein
MGKCIPINIVCIVWVLELQIAVTRHFCVKSHHLGYLEVNIRIYTHRNGRYTLAVNLIYAKVMVCLQKRRRFIRHKSRTSNELCY